VHGEGTEPDEEPAVAGLDELALGHEAQVTARAGGEEERVVEALVVRRDDRRALGRDVLGTRDVHPEVEVHEGDEHGAHHRVERA
jgi:hypothetical protein